MYRSEVKACIDNPVVVVYTPKKSKKVPSKLHRREVRAQGCERQTVYMMRTAIPVLFQCFLNASGAAAKNPAL